MRNLLRRLFLSIRQKYRVVILDYPVIPVSRYTKDHPHQTLYRIIAASDGEYAQLLHSVLSYTVPLQSIRSATSETDPAQPAWNNRYLPGLDVMLLYTILCEFKPGRYLEIGSGTSTKTAFKARNDHGLSFSITCIDPFPRQEIRNIADQWHSVPVQDVPLEVFSSLSAGDVLFFDGTHTLLPNSDVSWFFLEVLPVLAPGVIVQIHDIYLPYDYPQFMLDRYYSENYILGAVLLSNPEKYEVLAPAWYISGQEHLSSVIKDLWLHPNLAGVEKHGGSFWFRVK